MFLLCFLLLKHNIKKIRNNLEKSRECGNPRCLKINGKRVTWQLFKDAYNWDQRSFSLPLHEKLTTQHFELDPASKMRNHLAEEVLDDKMLFLVQKYQEEINSIGKDGSKLEGAICLLRHTSNLIQLFHDKMPIASTKDHRLKKLDDFYRFIMNWNEETRENKVDFISAKLFLTFSQCV